MADKLQGKTIAILATEGLEQIELTEPRKAVEAEGATVELLSLEAGEFQGFEHLDKGETFTADKAVGDADVGDYDGLILPGGVANPDFLRGDQDAVSFVRDFVASKKPLGVICHGPWTLVEADVLKGRTLTSWPSLQTDLRNAGATWVDEEVHVDQGLVSSRNPDDLPAFCAKIVEEFCEGRHDKAPEPAGTGASTVS
jgi:protease I